MTSQPSANDDDDDDDDDGGGGGSDHPPCAGRCCCCCCCCPTTETLTLEIVAATTRTKRATTTAAREDGAIIAKPMIFILVDSLFPFPCVSAPAKCTLPRMYIMKSPPPISLQIFCRGGEHLVEPGLFEARSAKIPLEEDSREKN